MHTNARPTLILSTLCAVFLISASAAIPGGHPVRKSDTTRTSKNGKLEAVIEGVSVTLTYGRPKVKKRKVWGSLVGFSEVWRVGSDEATAISFSDDVKIEGKSLAAGTYALFAIPTEKKWTLVFNSAAEQWGAYSYEAKKDALRVDVTPKPTDHVEELTFVNAGNAIELRWEKLAVAFSVSAGK